MLRDSLREKNFITTPVYMSLPMLNICSWLFVILFTIASIILRIYIVRIMVDIGLNPITLPMPVIVFPIIAIYIYFAFVTIVSKFFCESKTKNTKLRFIEKIKMPTCTCVEALKVKQLVITYSIAIFVNLLLFSVVSGITGDLMFSLMAVFGAILIAPDASLVLYILYLNKKQKPDYVLIEDHLSSIILFKK